MKIKKIEIRCHDRKMNVLLQMPDKENPPAIIMVHGFGGEGLDEYFIDTGKKLSESGFCVVNFLFSGYNDFPDVSNLTIKDSIEDLRCIVDFVYKQNIDKNRIAIVAQSLGCVITMLYTDDRIKAAAFLGPTINVKESFSFLFKRANILEELEEKGIATYTSISSKVDKKIGITLWNEIKKIDHITEEQIKKNKIPVLIIRGTADTLVDAGESKKLYEILNEPKKLFLVQDAPHSTTKNPKQRGIVVQEISTWFNKWLR